ncbi:unnamed protein product, partial [Arabidopsis halleri]
KKKKKKKKKKFSLISSKFINYIPQLNWGSLQFFLRPRNSGVFERTPDNGVERVQVLHSTSRLGFDHDLNCHRDYRIHILRRCRSELALLIGGVDSLLALLVLALFHFLVNSILLLGQS